MRTILACLMLIPAVALAEDGPPTESGKYLVPWFELDLGSAFGYDTNALRLTADDKGSSSLKSALVADFRFTQYEESVRTSEIGLGLVLAREDQEVSSARQNEHGLWLSFDKPVAGDCAHSWGVLAKHSAEDDGRRASSHRTEFVPAFSFDLGDSTDPKRAVVYASSGTLDERFQASGGPVNLDGHHVAVGAEFSLHHFKDTESGVPTSDDVDPRFYQSGIFRNLYLDDYININVGYEHRRESTNRAEYDRDLDRLWFDGQVPLNRESSRRLSNARRCITLDWSARYDYMGHRHASAPTATKPHGTFIAVDVGVLFPLMSHQDWKARPFQMVEAGLRVGVGQSWLDSNMAGNDYDATAISLTFRAKFGRIGGANEGTDEESARSVIIPATGSTLNPESGSGPGTSPPPIIVVR